MCSSSKRLEYQSLVFLFSSFHTFDVALNSSCLPFQSKEEIKQLSVPSSEKKEEKEIWPPEESVSGGSFELSPFSCRQMNYTMAAAPSVYFGSRLLLF